MNNDNVMDKEEKRGIFLGIIGVLTLIVAIIGASFAYFSLNVSSGEDAVTVQAATLKIVYNDGDGINVENIIPSDREIALKTVTRAESDKRYTRCVDDNNRTVCGVYDFELINNGPEAVDFFMTVTPYKDLVEKINAEEAIGFTNLKFSLYDITEKFGDNPINIGEDRGREGINTMKYTNFSLLGDDDSQTKGRQTIEGVFDKEPGVKRYRLFIWLDALKNDAGEEIAQDGEQGAAFKGQINIELADERNVTGTINE